MKVSNMKCKLEHWISTMVICGSYMFEFSVSMDMTVEKVASHLCLTLAIKELKISVEHDRVVTTLDIIKHLNILFSVLIMRWLMHAHTSLVWATNKQLLRAWATSSSNLASESHWI